LNRKETLLVAQGLYVVAWEWMLLNDLDFGCN
jgi:hypothetical protein